MNKDNTISPVKLLKKASRIMKEFRRIITEK
jgi:hypothetical protein